MEAAEEQTTTVAAADYEGPTDITNVAKGKRTKRQRPQSPIRFAFSPSNNNEDEDTAESLILLSRGQSLIDVLTARKNKDDYDGVFKFNSKRYIQSTDTGTGGVFVYECKTCSRTFSSFQALGGHRASHRKPRNYEDTRKAPPLPPEYLSWMNNDHYSSSSSILIQLNNQVKASSRVHECSICGKEFNSGQALGGHMRRHRVAGGRNKNVNATATLSLIPFSDPVTMYDRKAKNDALCLGLDLNLPAPRETADNQHQKRSFAFSLPGESEKKQQPAVHVVDCQY
ncbi:hypothetical protein L1987_75755 [Smallanthus sonchifolius]|uniref:Uncharacterized protein n=1 Tax=Smallanthus sonchifolius TaxID=185202 RepID=A0ACB9A6B7_9ASTR|nr:hypothetical protein L1987_75755 [Smallanthus sonchifolius]